MSDFIPAAVVSCHEASDVDVGGQVPRCAQSGAANCAVAARLIHDASLCGVGRTSEAEIPFVFDLNAGKCITFYFFF